MGDETTLLGGTEGGGGEGGGGGGGVRFQDSLPEDIRSEPSLQDFKGVDGLAKSYVALNAKLGGSPESLVSVPADGEDFVPTFRKLGMPEKASEYDMGLKSTLKHSVYDDDMQQRLRESYHDAGLTKGQAAKLTNSYFSKQEEFLEQAVAAQQVQRDKNVDTLKTEWGDKFEANKELARRAVQDFGGKDLVDLMSGAQASDGSKLGDSPTVLRLFAKIGGMSAEHTTPAGATGGSPMDKATAEARLAEFEQNKDKMALLQDKMSPQHQATMDEYTRLGEARWGTEVLIGESKSSATL